MSLRRWNSVMGTGDARPRDTEIASSNLRKMRSLTFSSPSVAEPRILDAEDEDSDYSVSSDDGLRLSPTKNKARQRKFLRHFQKEEPVLEYYSCAYVAEILLQGFLYISKHHVGFYSNVFGKVTKILIPVRDIEKITKNNTAYIFPNAIRIYTKDEKYYAFASFISRDAVCQVMDQVMIACKSRIEKRKSTLQLRFQQSPEQAEDEYEDNESDLCHDNIPEDEDSFNGATNDKGDTQSFVQNETISSSRSKSSKTAKLKLYLLAILTILLSLSALNLYFRIEALLLDEEPRAPAQLTDSLKAILSQQLDHHLIIETVSSKVNETLERIRQINAALEHLKADVVLVPQ